jgi:hypothetical protein
MMTRSLTTTNIALTLFLAAAAAWGQTAKLVVAGQDGWSTTLAAKNTTATAATLPLTDCTSGPSVQLRLEPGAHALARNIVPWLCALRGAFGLMDVPDVGRLETHLRYRDHAGATSFYVIPALRMKLERMNDSAHVPMIVNDDVEQTWAVVFGDPGPITFEIFNEHGTLVHTEVADEKDFISPWRMLIYPIQQRIPIGTLVITEGDKTRPAPSVDDETYYGFVIVGARDGSSNHVRAWE